MSHIIRVPSFPHRNAIVLLGRQNNEADRVNPAAVSIVSLLPSPISGSVGGVINLTATISAVQPIGTSISISTNAPLVLGVPSSVTVLAGNLTVNVPVNLLSAGSGTVTSTLNGAVSSNVTVTNPSVSWPNEPPGSTVLLDCPFTSATCNGGFNDPYNTVGNTVTVVEDSSAPMSPPYVLRSTEDHLTGNGGTELQWTAPVPITEIYVGYWWKTNPEFTGNNPNANKTLFIRGTQGGQNGVFYLRTNPGDPKVLYWSTQLAYNLDQCFGAPDQDACWPNVNTTPIVPGTWNFIEIYMKASTCPTCHDGAVRWWVNGVSNGNFSNFAYGPLVNQVVWSETWDGGGNGSGFTSDPSHYLDHMRISAPNYPG